MREKKKERKKEREKDVFKNKGSINKRKEIKILRILHIYIFHA